MDKEDVGCIYSVLLFSHKKEMLTFVTTWLDLEEIMLSEMKLAIQRQISHHLTYIWNQNSNHTNKMKRDSYIQRLNRWLAERNRVEDEGYK